MLDRRSLLVRFAGLIAGIPLAPLALLHGGRPVPPEPLYLLTYKPTSDEDALRAAWVRLNLPGQTVIAVLDEPAEFSFVCPNAPDGAALYADPHATWVSAKDMVDAWNRARP